MPRNIRTKTAPPARSQPKRRRGSDSSSSLDLSSDGGYSALEEVSDADDDDEEGVCAVEEKAIIKDVIKARHARSPRPTVQTAEDDADEDDEDDDSDSDSDSDSDDSDTLGESELPVGDADDDEDSDDEADESEGANLADDAASWNGISESDAVHHTSVPAAAGLHTHTVKRQVRFAGVPDSDSDSSTSGTSDIAAEFFPDIFVEQNSLDPSFRREIEQESDSSVSSSFWDYASGYGQHTGGASAALSFSDDDVLAAALANQFPDPFDFALAPVAAEAGAQAGAADNNGEEEDDDDDDSEDLDGYETDGETTEEDEPEPLPLRRKQARRVLSIDSDDETSDEDSDNDLPVRHRRGHPRVRRFALTLKGRKPIAVMHPITGDMVIITADKPHESEAMSDPFPAPGMDLTPTTNNNNNSGLNAASSSAANNSNHTVAQSSPLLSNTASVMMGAMFSSNTFGDFMHSQHVGPVEAFFPMLSSDSFLAEDSDFSGELIQDDGESNLRIEDFIQFDRNVADSTDPVDEPFDMNAILGTSEVEDLLGLGPGGMDDFDATILSADTPTPVPRTRRASFMATSSVLADDEAEEGQATGGAMLEPAQPDAAEDDANDLPLPPLLAHFGKNTDAVGAFRRNQITQQLINSSKATADSLAFSGPYTMGTLRGIKSGSLEAVSIPITPPRRPKRRPSVGAAYSGAGDPSVQKRKASSALAESSSFSHKRQRSISEVKDLML